MTSREKILSRIKTNQPKTDQVIPVDIVAITISNPLEKFKEVLTSIGGAAVEISSESEISKHLVSILPARPEVNIVGPNPSAKPLASPHALKNTDLAILRGEFGVAENGSVWITDRAMIDRALPFICSHLVLIIRKSAIVSTMHDAYEKIGQAQYDFGTFIAGPSKTADIEQSLVLGAHGAKTLTCFIIAS
jgi:L-lactate dehydrogenase complex protein LldG